MLLVILSLTRMSTLGDVLAASRGIIFTAVQHPEPYLRSASEPCLPRASAPVSPCRLPGRQLPVFLCCWSCNIQECFPVGGSASRGSQPSPSQPASRGSQALLTAFVFANSLQWIPAVTSGGFPPSPLEGFCHHLWRASAITYGLK